jgi:nucleoside-diphosphate-sugar epimerase
VRELVERGAATTAHLRPDSPRLSEWRERFAALGAQVDETPWEASAMGAGLAELSPSHVFCSLGTHRARKESYAEVDVALTGLLVAASTGLPAPPRFVLVSSLGVEPDARGAYLRARWDAEELVRASGLPFTIARPPIILGPRDDSRPLEALAGWAMAAMAQLGGLVRGPRFRDRYRPTDDRELAWALVRSGFAHTTIDRVLFAEELRRRTAVDEPDWAPRSHRDHGRH